MRAMRRDATEAAPQERAQRSIPAEDFEHFVGLISHDVRNSTRALLMVPQWIREDLETAGVPLAGPLQENLDLLGTHTRRVDRMLSDLIVHARVGLRQTQRIVRFDEAIDAALKRIDLPDSIVPLRDLRHPSIRIGDEDILTLIGALVDNAIRHRDAEATFVKIATCLENEFCLLTVEDDGPGIPERYRRRVFEAMTTLKPRDEVEGSGMGLATVRKIAAHYGGAAQISDRQGGRGTRLLIRLPT